MQVIDSLVHRLDGFQRRRAWLAFPVAVGKKFSDDGAGRLAALIAYYGFFSLFPLLLVLTTAVGFVLQGNRRLQQRVLDSALAQFPIVGQQISTGIHAISGSGLVLVLGTAGALWAGLGVVQASQHAMNEIWAVPPRSQPNYLTSRVRSVTMLLVAGGVLVCSAALSGIASAAGALIEVLSLAGSILLSFVVFVLAFRLLTTAQIAWRDVLPGAAVAAVGWAALQYAGAFYVARVVARASDVYGFFAIVIGLLSWIAIGARLVLYAAEVNVVRARRLWPRSLSADEPARGPAAPSA